MSAVTDKWLKAVPLYTDTLAGAISNATATTFTVTNGSTDLENGEVYEVTIDRVDSDGEATGRREVVVAQYTSATKTFDCSTDSYRGIEGLAQAHAIGSVVEILATSSFFNKRRTSWMVGHNQDGTHASALPLTSPVLTTPKIVTSINDANGNEVIKTPATTSAVNEVTITNAATGNAVQVSATGGDTNISLNLVSKGSGTVQVNGVAISTTTDGWTAAGETWTYASASTFTISGVDVTAKYTKGTRLKFTQTTVKYAVVVASSFSTNTTVTIAVNTDYTLANAAITDNYFSYQASPVGYPVAFNVTVTNGLESKISMIGRELTIYGWSYLLQAAGGSTTVEKTITHGFTFASVPIVVAELIGIKYTSAPTTISDLTTTVTGDGLYKNFALSGITTTVFKAHSGQTGNSGADTYRGFSWMVKGVL